MFKFHFAFKTIFLFVRNILDILTLAQTNLTLCVKQISYLY